MNEEVVELWVLDMRTDLMDFGVGQNARVSEQIGGYPAEIADSVEELDHLGTYHSAHTLVA